MNLFAARGISVRELLLEKGFADYLLFVDRKTVGLGLIQQRNEQLTNSVAQVQHTQMVDELVPFPEQVQALYVEWL